MFDEVGSTQRPVVLRVQDMAYQLPPELAHSPPSAACAVVGEWSCGTHASEHAQQPCAPVCCYGGTGLFTRTAFLPLGGRGRSDA